ncbi:MAG TPA: tetratricopeptide repeat protein, partial [Candidatus Acidoferrales bacterium]
QMRGDFPAALAHSERALTFAPADATLLLNVAYLRLRRGEYTEALDLLDRARRQRPDSPDVAKLTGWADYGLNRLAQAVEEWKRAQQLRPDAQVAQALEKAERDFETESNFREGESAHFVLRYNGSAAPELARGVLVVLEDDFQTLASAFNFTPKEPIAVILYTGQAFGDITRAPSWVGALNDGRIRIPVQGLASVTPELARVLKHELTHSFVTEMTHGRSPVWLQEGLAQWMEGKRSGDAATLLVELYDHHEDPSLPLLEGPWMNLSSDIAGVAYAWSLAVVEAIESGSSANGASDGPSDIGRLLDRVSVEPTAEGALRSAQHIGYAELARSTAEYLRQTYLHQR